MNLSNAPTGIDAAPQRRARRDRAIRELFEIGPQLFGYADECLRVLNLNRQRSRGHEGRGALARDIKLRRGIARSRNAHS